MRITDGLFSLDSLAVLNPCSRVIPLAAVQSVATGRLRGGNRAHSLTAHRQPRLLVQIKRRRAALPCMTKHVTPWSPGLRTKMRSLPWAPWLSARGLKRQKQYERKRLEKQPLQQEDKCGILSAFLSSVLSLGPMLDCSRESKLVNWPI